MKHRVSGSVWDIPALYALDPRHARLIWRSVEGERFVRALQGMDIPLVRTERNGYGNSKVLAPKYRNPHSARLVARWLTEKASERLRRDGYCAKRFSLMVHMPDRQGYSRSLTLTASQDTAAFHSLLDRLWIDCMRTKPRVILSVGVQLSDVTALAERPGELFLPLEPGAASSREKLATTIDRLNRRFGGRVVTFGVNQAHPGFFEKG